MKLFLERNAWNIIDVHCSPDSRMTAHHFLRSVSVPLGKVLAGKTWTACQALDVAPNMTSKLMFRRSIQTILSSGVRLKVFFVMNTCVV